MADKLTSPSKSNADSKYSKIEKIGVGSHGVVIKAKDNRTGGLWLFILYLLNIC